MNIVFHMAATVRFDEKLKIAMQINVQACKDIMQICSEMLHLKSVVHVSTAYTQCPLRRVEERFYTPPIDSGKLLVLSECVSDKLLESITPILLDKWPNTYTYTKAIAEDVVQQHGRGMPVGMFRPGIGEFVKRLIETGIPTTILNTNIIMDYKFTMLFSNACLCLINA